MSSLLCRFAEKIRQTAGQKLAGKEICIDHIVGLHGWESLDMVLRYTRLVKFEDSLRLCRRIEHLLRRDLAPEGWRVVRVKM